MDWDRVRKLFPATESFVYLNAAEGSPVSIVSAAEAKTFYDEILREGDLPWERWLRKMEDVRKKVAKFINADEKEIAFILNTSHGMNLVAQMLKGAKSEVVTMEDEFPSSTLPWLNLGYELRFVKSKNAIYLIEDIERNIFSLGGALDLMNGIGKGKVEERIYELGDYLVERLEELKLVIVSPLDKKYRSGITVLKMEIEDADRVVQQLYGRNVIVSARGEGLRISVHIYNNEEDVDKLVSELRKLV